MPGNISITYRKDDIKVFTSRIALTQVLMNLINNAIKYNDKENGNIYINFEELPDKFVFQVKDNGPGISEEDQAKMFNLFERLKASEGKKEGTGIGLSVVKRLVEKINGQVSVSSKQGEGATFLFTIPKNKVPAQGLIAS